MSGLVDFITGESAGAQRDMADASAQIAKEQAAMGRDKEAVYQKNFFPAERDFIQETMGYDPAEIQRYNDAQAEIARLEARRDSSSKQIDAPLWQNGLFNPSIGVYNKPGFGLNKGPFPQAASGFSAEDQARLDALRNVPRPSSRSSGLSPETTAGLARIDELAKGDPRIAAELEGLAGATGSPVSAQDYLDASRQGIDYWNVDPTVLAYESQRAAEAAQQESDSQQQDIERQMLARGINPGSSKFAGVNRAAGLSASGNRIAAINNAISSSRDREYARKIDDYTRRLQGMGLANETEAGNFARKAGVLDTRRALGMDQFNKGLQAYSTKEGTKLTDFNKRNQAIALGKGFSTQGVQLLGQGQVGMQNTAGIYGQMADRSNQMASDLIGAAVKGYGLSQM